MVRQLFTEGLVLACGAGALAFGLAAILPRLLFSFMDEEIPPYIAARLVPDGWILIFTLGIAPAGRACRIDPATTLREG